MPTNLLSFRVRTPKLHERKLLPMRDPTHRMGKGTKQQPNLLSFAQVVGVDVPRGRRLGRGVLRAGRASAGRGLFIYAMYFLCFVIGAHRARHRRLFPDHPNP